MRLEDRIKYKCSGIYKITNIKTKHCYIGQARNICTRIYGHIRSSVNSQAKDYSYPLHAAIRKYGIDSFELDILEFCECDRLNEREKYWISIFDSKKLGYNQTDGGSQSISFRKLTDKQLIKIFALLKDNVLSNRDIANKFHVTEDLIGQINIGTSWHSDDISYPVRQTSKVIKNHFNGYCIEQYDIKTNKLIAKFSSATAAGYAIGNAENCGINIMRCCKGKRKSAYGYIWKLTNISEAEWLKINNLRN